MLRTHPPVLIFVLFTRTRLARSVFHDVTRKRDRSASQRVVSHFYLAKAGLHHECCFWSVAPYAEPIRGLRRTRDNAPHKFAMSELSREIRMMWFSVVVIKSSVIVSRKREILLGSRT